MASVHDYSTTAASNNSAAPDGAPENMPASGLNDAMRQFMANVKGFATVVATSGTDTYTATLAPAPTAYAAGMVVFLRFGNVNTSTTPTINLNTLGAKTITTRDGGAVAAGDLDGDHALAYDGTNFRVMNPAGSAIDINGLTAETTAADADLIPIYDSSATANRKMTRANFLADVGKMPRSYLAGLGLANNGTDATNDIDIAVGACRDSTNAADIVLASALTKQLDAAWAVGTNQGGLDTGSIANGTYHVWLIKRSDTGVVDVLFSTSASAPTMPTNYDYKRRIGSIVRVSAAIKAFSQIGDEFLWKSPVLDVDAANPGTSAVLRALTIPSGVKVNALLNAQLDNLGTAVNAHLYLSSPDVDDEASSLTAAPLNQTGLTYNGAGGASRQSGQVNIRSNTSAQIRSRLGASDGDVTLKIATVGWIDRRGRDD